MKFRRSLSACLLVTLTLVSGIGVTWAQQGSVGVAPKPLVNLASPDALKQLKANYGDPEFSVSPKGIAVTLPAARSNYPGIQVFPATGDTWDLSPFGHVEARIVNTGEKLLRFTMSVGSKLPDSEVSNAEVIGVKPGESKVIKVIFGYSFGFKPANRPSDPSKTSRIILFADKSDVIQSFRVEDLQAAGAAGEKPPFNPDYVLTKPANGVILGKGVAFDLAKQVIAEGAKVSPGPNGAIAVNLTGGKEETVKIKPVMGSWDLTDANQIRVKFKNVGATAVTPSVVVGPNKVSSKAPIAPGTEAEIIVSFIPQVSTVCTKELITKGNLGPLPGTGTKFESNKAKEFSILSDSTPGAKSLLITSIVADAAVDEIPAWLGKRPPVAGDWVQTFDEEFNAPTLDYTKWNIYGHNYWDKRTHFSKNNAILKGGNMIFHFEKKTGWHNDEENCKETGKTDYACGFLNTYGKFTQRYGYFEARMKLPKAPGLWPAFWLMPDRGPKSGTHYRVGTGKQPDTDKGVGGMEFDIMEFLSGWGTNRFNVAFHWDGYGKEHKSVSSDRTYVGTDKDKYITTGLLWTPGLAVVYNNGKEIFRWENARVSDVQEYIMFDMVTGGWDNPPLDDAKLPDDFFIDYVRVWQRKDLATPEDGPKPNNGIPDERKN